MILIPLRYWFITILIIILGVPSSLACSAAYQYSLFPLGKSEGKLIVLEVELDRYLTSPGNQMMRMGGGVPGGVPNAQSNLEVRWKGYFKVLIQQADTFALQEDLGHVDVLDEDYEEALAPFFQQAYEAAKALPNFEEARLESVGHCHYDRSCGFMELIMDEDSVAFYARSTEPNYDQQPCKIIFKEKDLLKVEKQTTIKFTDFETLDKEYQLDFFRLWSPQTVRRYSIGTQTIQVFSLGRGDKSRYTGGSAETTRKQPNLEHIGRYIQGNDVLFHGQRFDVLHLL
ncbi:MAG: hypothetical protein AB8E82_11085 [Aureispira sp.]